MMQRNGKWVLDGKPKDPWCFQHLLPFEHLESGEVVIFVTPSVGGMIATEELVREYARRLKRKVRARCRSSSWHRKKCRRSPSARCLDLTLKWTAGKMRLMRPSAPPLMAVPARPPPAK